MLKVSLLKQKQQFLAAIWTSLYSKVSIWKHKQAAPQKSQHQTPSWSWPIHTESKTFIWDSTFKSEQALAH